ncbi:MAG: hypothetical protein AB1402_03025 [Bacillota bacterium]
MVQVISIETLREKRRAGTIEVPVSFLVDGKEYQVTKRIVNGEMETLQLTKPIGELLTLGSIESIKDLVGKAVLDVELGREKVPVLYRPIYDIIEDKNLPPVVDAKWALGGACVFTEHMEGEEVKFGKLYAEEGPSARILPYSAGFEYTKFMKDFNQSFSVEMLNKAIGEAYNALVNHIHLYPIFAFTYPAANKTAYAGAAEDPAWVGVWKTIQAAKKDAAKKKRKGTVLLANSANEADIQMALEGGHQIAGTKYPGISGISAVVYYDGWEVTVGKKTHNYPGVPENKAYLVRPERGFKALLKQDLRLEAARGDLARLVEAQIVGYAYRGVFAAVGENVQELSLQ